MLNLCNKFVRAVGLIAAACVAACSHDSSRTEASASAAPASAPPASQNASVAAAKPTEPAPPASETGVFDGAKAYDQVAKIESFGPRPPDSEGIHRVQDYIRGQLQSFGCTVDEDDFHASTPAGPIAMKNIIAKIPGTGQGIILLLTHYDSLGSVPNFVGAEDSASPTGVMLEEARLLCGKKQANAVWIVFLDGEEAIINGDKDN